MIICDKGMEIKVLKAYNGWYIGSKTSSGEPYCRISYYYDNKEDAEKALENKSFCRRICMENQFCGLCKLMEV